MPFVAVFMVKLFDVRQLSSFSAGCRQTRALVILAVHCDQILRRLATAGRARFCIDVWIAIYLGRRSNRAPVLGK